MREGREHMSDGASAAEPGEPRRFKEADIPSIPAVDEPKPGQASVQLSQYRTQLSTRRTEMSMRRTGMSFQRTRLSAERTLMSVIRTSLSLIGFGFTIFQLFEKLRDRGVLANVRPLRSFGIALVALGILLLIGGIIYHMRFMYGLRAERRHMAEQGLIHAEMAFPVSFTLITAVLLLLLGAAAIISMAFNIGPLR